MSSSQTKPKSQRERKIGSTICFDCDLSNKCVYNCLGGVGMRNSIMIVGEKPSPADAKGGNPFYGLEGYKLNFLLERAGLNREAVFLTHAVKCDPPKKTTKLQKAAQACKSHLVEEIQWVKPKVIVTMGSLPLSVLSGESITADNYRGFPFPLQNRDGEHITWVVPTLSMGQAIGSADSDPIIVRDIKLAKRIAKEGYSPPPVDIKVQVINSLERLKGLIKDLYAAPEWSFDLETGGLDFLKHKILCCSFSIDGKSAFVLPIDKEFTDSTGTVRMWTADEREKVLWAMGKIFQSPARKTAQNGKFDTKFLRTYKIAVHNFDFDTMLAHHLVDADKPHDLLFIAQWYGLVHEKYDKALDQQKIKHGADDFSKFDHEILYYYAGVDAAVTQGARPILEAEMERVGTLDVFRRISIPQTRVLGDMEYRGAHIDLQGMFRIIKEVDEKILDAKAKVKEVMEVDDFNPNSTKQLKDFFVKNRVRLNKLTPAGQPSVDEEVLKGISYDRRYKDTKVGQVAALTLEARGLTKLKGTYLDGSTKGKQTGLLHRIDENHYIHTNFNIHGAYTGRLSSDKPNLQNIPKAGGIRQLFMTDHPDDILMSVDYKQLEVRVAAAISKDRTLIQEILEGVDMHSRNASEFLMKIREAAFIKVINDKDHPDCKMYGEKRRTAKAVTFGVLYGSTAHGVSKRNNVPLDECELFISRFFRKYSGLKNWIDRQHTMVRNTHKVKTPTGRFIRFADLEWATSKWCPQKMSMMRLGEAERISVNMPIQGFGSDIFQSHKIKVFRYLAKKKMQSRLVLSLHDGFVLNVKPDERAELEEVVPKLMHTKINKGTRYEVPLDVDLEFGKRWEGKDE